MNLPDSEREKTNRRGCYLLAAGGALILLLLIAISMGWLGQVDRGKVSDLPVMQTSG
jgi:hypothetical protein